MGSKGQKGSHTMVALTRSQGTGAQVWAEPRAILVAPETAMEIWGTGYPGVTDKEIVISTNQTRGSVGLTPSVTPFGARDQARKECSLSLAHTSGAHSSGFRIY